MFRSLHMKLVLIMLLLITSLMAVVGAFLMTSVTNFYIDDFYSQMGETFGESNADFVNSLRAEAAQEGGVAVMQSMLETYSGTLGIDSRSRNYYILDAASGECLAASDELGGEKLEQTANLLTARNGQVGDDVRTVDVTVRRLREKIEDDPASPRYILTRRGVGYYYSTL